MAHNHIVLRYCPTCHKWQARERGCWVPPIGCCINDGKGQPPRTQNAVLEALADGPLHRDAIAERCGKTTGQVASALTRLRKAEKVRRKDKMWELVNG